MLIFITTSSILLISVIFLLANKILSIKICPICAGVGATWFGLLILSFLDYQIDLMIPAILMGGSVVGTAYALEKKLNYRQQLLWKMLFIPIGFVAVYSLLVKAWSQLSISIVIILVVLVLFVSKHENRKTNQENIRQLEKRMKGCC